MGTDRFPENLSARIFTRYGRSRRVQVSGLRQLRLWRYLLRLRECRLLPSFLPGRLPVEEASIEGALEQGTASDQVADGGLRGRLVAARESPSKAVVVDGVLENPATAASDADVPGGTPAH